MSEINFKKIDVEDFLNELGLNKVSKKGNQVWFSCPLDMHIGADSTPSISMEIGTTRTHCFGCGFSGNAISFLSELEGISSLKARRFVRERFNMGIREPNETFASELNKKLDRMEARKQNIIPKTGREYHILKEEEVDKRLIDWYEIEKAKNDKIEANAYPFAYMLDRGFHPDILNKWAIGWDMISQRICIPIRDDLGNLVGFKGRAVDFLPKYLVLGGPEYGFDTYNVSEVLFGLNEAKNFINETMIVVEGELNAISMHQDGWDWTVGISGKHLSENQEELIKKYCGRAIFIFDEQNDSIRAAKSLEPYIATYIAPPHKSDPADMTQEEKYKLLWNAEQTILL